MFFEKDTKVEGPSVDQSQWPPSLRFEIYWSYQTVVGSTIASRDESVKQWPTAGIMRWDH